MKELLPCISDTSFPDEKDLVLHITEKNGRCGMKKFKIGLASECFSFSWG